MSSIKYINNIETLMSYRQNHATPSGIKQLINEEHFYLEQLVVLAKIALTTAPLQVGDEVKLIKREGFEDWKNRLLPGVSGHISDINYRDDKGEWRYYVVFPSLGDAPFATMSGACLEKINNTCPTCGE